MPKSPNIQARIDAIAKELSNGVSPRDFIPKITKKYNVSIETVNKDIKKAKEGAKQAQEIIKKAEADALYETTKEAEKRRLLSRDEKRELLCQIALGQMEVEKVISTRDGIERIKCLPDHTDIMKAIDLDSKMEGDYAANKMEVSGMDVVKRPVVVLKDGTVLEL